MTARRLAPIVLLVVVAACSGTDDAEPVSTPVATSAAATDPPPSTATPTTAPPTTVATAPTATETPVTTTTAPTEPQPEPWAPVGSGEYDVGIATVTIDDPAGERPLTVDVWFPLDAAVDAAALSPHRYTFLPDVYYESPAAFTATADQLADDGPFPLIVYSHGSGGLRYVHSGYTEALASHGYVVVAADHTGNTVMDDLAGTRAEPGVVALARPLDVRRLVDVFVDPGHPVAGPFAAGVDVELVAVTGHSVGGFTALASVTGIATGLGEAPADERVDAIVLLAPALGPTTFPDETLASIIVPMMALVGTDDISTPVDPNVTRLWDESVNAPAYRVELVAAEHQTFSDVCVWKEFVPELPDVPQLILDTIDEFAVQGCSPGDMDHGRASELTNTYVIQFLDQVLHGGPAIDPSVIATPDDVIFDSR